MSYLNVNIPYFWAFLDEGFLYDRDPDHSAPRIPIEVFMYTSIPNRCGLWTAMTEWGTQHSRIPTQYLYREPEGGLDVPLDYLQLWDSFSYHCSALTVDYLKNRGVEVLLKDRRVVRGTYLFTLDWGQGGYAEMAAGHKTGHVLDCDGRILVQPNNRVIRWTDGGAFTTGRLPGRPDWKVFSKEFSCEQSGGRWVAADEDEVYWYDFKEVDDEISDKK